MNYFFKINVVSMLYALLLFIPIELMINVNRISRLVDLDVHTVNDYSFAASMIVFVSGTFFLFLITKKWLKGVRANFWTALLWIPYFVFFVYVLAASFPVKSMGDMSSPGAGLVGLALLIMFPFYILLVNYFNYMNKDELSKE
ncbi:hypothetical protein HP456_21820 [Bacillus haikouensis]|uniref:hypothetical protein n=1 Tax=Bacillus haikouensis TaxID=1510468 RepID=UPI00155175B3|nr:hypothetical protein [Bacillus haikouensis]NQD68551.1 hypothetical protein [Bacillus haikouensis]